MSIDDYRQRIDELDTRLVALLNERAELSIQIGKLKASEGSAVYAPDREKMVIDRVVSLNKGPLSADALKDIYQTIVAGSRALQQPLRIAYLGPAGTNTHEAAQRRFGKGVVYLPMRSIPDIFTATEKEQADYGVVPVENSTGGIVPHTLDMFVDSELQICAEIALLISQHLLSKSGLASIRRVYSHPQAIAQSRTWLADHLPSAELIEVASTSRAAEIAAMEEDSAAIASEIAAEIYGLDVVARRIEDSTANITRFLVIGSRMGLRSGSDKTSLIFSIKDRVGALHDALDVFRSRNINLTKIESRPSKRKAWDYLFFVDIVGHPEDKHVAEALAALGQACVLVKVLGSWPLE